VTRAWSEETDVVVVGSGAAGLTAAVAAAEGGLSVRVLEKASLLGGTTAVGGGGIWVPGNPHMRAMGLADDRDEAVAYALSSTGGHAPDPALVETYVDRVVEATTFLEARTPIEFFVAEVFSDYYLERHGARRLGRTLDNAPYAARDALGAWDERIRRSPHYPALTLDEISRGAPGEGDRSGGAGAAPFGAQTLALAAEREAAGVRTLGSALIARLLRGALDFGVCVATDAPVERLLFADDEDGAVVGVLATVDGEQRAIRARAGVVLASGGFEWNPQFVRAYLGVDEVRPVSAPSNVGDGLVMAQEAGALLGNMTEAWWFPTTGPGLDTYDGAPRYHVGTPRSEPGCIVVNAAGRRFTNEACCYADFGRTLRAFDAVAGRQANARAWAIFGQDVRDRIELGDLRPGEPTPAWVQQGDTLAELAEQVGIDPQGLAEEVARFNGFVEAGEDRDFARGTLWFEGFTSGGPDQATALAAIATPPFYAVAIHNGVLGTNGGPRTDADGRVLAARGGVVEGLYAAGNVAACVFGPGYPAGGATLGPAITFGYLAGRHLATRRAPSDTRTARQSGPS
jgi:succinate dehydrogenase/fumarate reductase flavoprotein subunit